MVNMAQLKSSDIVMVNEEGLLIEGTVIKTDSEEKMILVNNGTQEFWYDPQDVFPITLDEGQLLKFGFEKEQIEGATKYKKGVFRLVTPKSGDFSHVEMWYREDRRHFNTPIAVHELQNLHSDMTKVPLERV